MRDNKETVTSITEKALKALPKGKEERLTGLNVLEEELLQNLQDVEDKQRKLTRRIMMGTSPEKVLAEIAERYSVSKDYGVEKEEFDAALNEIRANKEALKQLRSLRMTRAEMTVTSVNASEIRLMDIAENLVEPRVLRIQRIS